jgi:hypothetical protein
MAQVIVKSLTEEEKTQMGIDNWPIWEKEVSRFEHTYDEVEHCLFLEGEVVIETEDAVYFIKDGDFVTFPIGLKCIWDIKKPVKKHYNFE